jgi:hypothetical protein
MPADRCFGQLGERRAGLFAGRARELPLAPDRPRHGSTPAGEDGSGCARTGRFRSEATEKAQDGSRFNAPERPRTRPGSSSPVGRFF